MPMTMYGIGMPTKSKGDHHQKASVKAQCHTVNIIAMASDGLHQEVLNVAVTSGKRKC